MIIIIELDKPLMLPAGIFSFSIPGKDLWSADVQLALLQIVGGDKLIIPFC
jgi:hypothetical protein